MQGIKHKKIKLSPHSRDKIGLFARDYDRDIYLENDIWSPYIFETKAYPEHQEKYGFFRFNQDVYQRDDNAQIAREKELERLEALAEKRRREEQEIAQQLALEKALENEMKTINKLKNNDITKKAKTISNTPPPTPAKKDITKLKIEKRNKLNPIEELYFQAIKEDGFKK